MDDAQEEDEKERRNNNYTIYRYFIRYYKKFVIIFEFF